MDPSHNLGYTLQHLAAILGRQADQVLQERLGIGFSQFKILLVLQDKPGVRQKHIAQMLGQTEASISRQIKLLIEQGLLTSEVHESNRREHMTTLTARGVRYTEEAQRILNDYHAPVFAHLSAKQQQQLQDILNIMHQEICLRSGADESHIFGF